MNDENSHTKDCLTKGVTAPAYFTQSARWPCGCPGVRDQSARVAVVASTALPRADEASAGSRPRVEDGGPVDRHLFSPSALLSPFHSLLSTQSPRECNWTASEGEEKW